ncbi:Na+/H+ antiporter NhaC [Salmonella enterica subsp. enterica serovar Enteritidis str. 648904 3-6]|nr:Na+/H+ antiporter NhaC [Salmonella enterica subsp. enterica serovar Enteritidis str. 648904 3-6]
MLLLLIIGYGIMGLRIEPLLLCSAAVAAGIAWWQGYCWEDIINSVVDKLAKAMPVIMILICVGGLIGTWMFSGTIPYMVYWGLKLISPEYILIAAFFLTSVVSVCTGTSWGSAGTVGVALMGVAAGLDVSLAAAAGAVVSGAYFGDKISPLSDSTNFAAIVADTTLFEHIQHLLWRPCQVSCLPPWFILSPDTVICWARWLRRSALRTSSTRWSRYTILILFLFCRR